MKGNVLGQYAKDFPLYAVLFSCQTKGWTVKTATLAVCVLYMLYIFSEYFIYFFFMLFF